jgi:hypothetical protein
MAYNKRFSVRPCQNILKILTTFLLVLAINTFALAEESKVPSPKQGPSSKSLTGKSVQMGGFSDGGGNAVGATLFDFYENAGTQEISIAELLNREPLAKKMILALDKEVPAVGNLKSEGFGTKLLTSVQSKKIFLERKDITSIGCQNQSMVAISNQMIAACQSDTEIRFNAEWLNSANSKNRAGLIMHELILAWARNMGGSKGNTEASVRELNRLLFTVDTSQYAQAVNEVFNINAFSLLDFAGTKNKVKISMAMLLEYKNTLHPSERKSLETFASSIASGSMSSGECFILVEMTNAIQSDEYKNKICTALD